MDSFKKAEKLEKYHASLQKDTEEKKKANDNWEAETTKSTTVAINICRNNGVFLWLDDLEDIFHQDQKSCEALFEGYKTAKNPSSVGYIDISDAKAWVKKPKKKNGLHDNWKDVPFKAVMDAVKIIASSNDEFIKFCEYLAK